MQPRFDDLTEKLIAALQILHAKLQQRTTLFSESIFTCGQVKEWMGELEKQKDDASIFDVFDTISQAAEGKNINVKDAFAGTLYRFIYRARIFQLEDYQLSQFDRQVVDYMRPENASVKESALKKIERILPVMSRTSGAVLFKKYIQPLLESPQHNINSIKQGLVIATLLHSEFMCNRYEKMMCLVKRYIDSHSHDQRELVCSLLNKDIKKLSPADRLAIFLLLDKSWEENRHRRSVEQINYIGAIWDDIPPAEQRRFVNIVYGQINKQMLSGNNMTMEDALQLQMIWNMLSAAQQQSILHRMMVDSRSSGNELQMYHQYAPLILMKIDVCKLDHQSKIVVRQLFERALASFVWSNTWYGAYLHCAALFSDDEAQVVFDKLQRYIAEGGNALMMLGAACLQLSYARRAKFVTTLIEAFNVVSLPLIKDIIKMMMALLSSGMEENLGEDIFSALLSRLQYTLDDLCQRVCQAEHFNLSESHWCRLILVFVDSFLKSNQPKSLLIESIVQAFNQLTYRSDKEFVLSRLLAKEHDWNRKRFLPCLLLRLHDALTHEQRCQATGAVIKEYLKNGDWTYEADAACSLMAVIPFMSDWQLTQILLKQFKTSDPTSTHNDAYALYLCVFREYEARLLVNANDSGSYLFVLPSDMQSRVRDYLYPSVSQRVDILSINP